MKDKSQPLFKAMMLTVAMVSLPGCSSESVSIFHDEATSGDSSAATPAYHYVMKLATQTGSNLYYVAAGATNIAETEIPPRITGAFAFGLSSNVTGVVPMANLKEGTFSRYHADGAKFPLSFSEITMEQASANGATQYFKCGIAATQATSGWVDLDCGPAPATTPFARSCMALAERSAATGVSSTATECAMTMGGEEKKNIKILASDPNGQYNLDLMVRQMAFLVDKKCHELSGGTDSFFKGTNQFYCSCFKDGNSNNKTPEQYFYADFVGTGAQPVNDFGKRCMAPVMVDAKKTDPAPVDAASNAGNGNGNTADTGAASKSSSASSTIDSSASSSSASSTIGSSASTSGTGSASSTASGTTSSSVGGTGAAPANGDGTPVVPDGTTAK